MEIILAFIIMLFIAIIAGVSLSLFSRLFTIEENPLKAQIRECLPGINCGACGYKGCDDYAEALSNGSVNPSLCIPGAQNVANEIGNILGIEAEPFKDVVAFVACNGHCEATSKKAIYEGVSTCHAASMIYGGNNSCRFGCLGLGDCAFACPSNAICLVDGIAHINTALCLGCGVCANTCPKHIIKMLPQETATAVMCSNTQRGADARKTCSNACIGCKKCEKTCNNGAIIVKDNLAIIDYEKCTNCGECVKACPTGCLKSVFFPNIPSDTNFEEILV